jgi:hypothetical protein
MSALRTFCLTAFLFAGCASSERSAEPEPRNGLPAFQEVIAHLCTDGADSAEMELKCIRVRAGEEAVLDCGDGSTSRVRAVKGTPTVVGCPGDAGPRRVYYVEADP